MINVWLKIRQRQDTDFVLRHLNFWMKTFSNKTLYNVWLYNENVILPNYFKKFNHINYLNKNIILEKYECKHLYNLIRKSKVISEWWKPTAFALSVPYFYMDKDQYIWNIDADDLKLEGPATKYLQSAYNFASSNKLETFSYDMLYSYNGKYASKRNHWTFGVNVSSSHRMREIVVANLYNMSVKPQINVGINLDLLIDNYLNYADNYTCFITKDKLHHMENCYTKYNDETKMVEVNDYGSILSVDKHPKTLVLE